jgi:SH3-like domain-containing protein
MKRIHLMLLVAIITLLFPTLVNVQAAPVPPAPQIAPHFEGIPGVVLFARVGLRRAPRATSSLIARLPFNEPILVLGRTYLADWVFISSRFGTGWVDRSFIRFNGRIRDLPISNVFPPFLTVTAAPSVNVRLGPGEGYPIITRLPPGVGVDVLATFRRASWYQIAMPGSGPIGWVRSDTAIVDGDTSAVPELPRAPILATVTSHRVRVHNGPKLNAPTVAVIRLAQVYSVVGADLRGNWWQIQGPFGTGWVLAAFVKVYGDWTILPAQQTEPIR